MDGYFPRWSLKTEGTIMPDERLPAGQTVVLGLQHVVAMFGATVLAPILMGFDPNVAIFFSGIATLIFFVVDRRARAELSRLELRLHRPGARRDRRDRRGRPNPNIGLALGGIIAAGALYTAIGVIVMVAGHRWVERLMPPVVTGAIVAAIGLVLAPIAIGSASGIGPTDPDGSAFARWVALITVVAVGARRGLRARPVAAAADPDRRRDRLPRLSRRCEPHGARQPDRFFEGRRRGLARPAELRSAGVRPGAPSA